MTDGYLMDQFDDEMVNKDFRGTTRAERRRQARAAAHGTVNHYIEGLVLGTCSGCRKPNKMIPRNIESPQCVDCMIKDAIAKAKSASNITTTEKEDDNAS